MILAPVRRGAPARWPAVRPPWTGWASRGRRDKRRRRMAARQQKAKL